MSYTIKIDVHGLTLPDNPKGIKLSSNWPDGAVCAVEYMDRDSADPLNTREWQTVYFGSIRGFFTWKKNSSLWIRSSGSGYSREYHLYTWDAVPVHFQSAFI